MLSISTYMLFCAYTQGEIGKNKEHQHPPYSLQHDINIYLHAICACTRSELDQTSNVTIHHIHCKHDINIYLLAILRMHTKRGRSNRQYQHSSYPLQTNINIYIPRLGCRW